MKQRVPDSSRLPLRAMVMVLLFLGVIFLLVGMQAVGSDGTEESSVSSIISTTQHTTTSTAAAAQKTSVVVLNTSSDDAVGTSAADRLTNGGFNVVETRKQELSGVTETTVFYSDAPGEQEAAEAVGRLMQAPVEPRGPGLAAEPPGVIVAVTG